MKKRGWVLIIGGLAGIASTSTCVASAAHGKQGRACLSVRRFSVCPAQDDDFSQLCRFERAQVELAQLERRLADARKSDALERAVHQEAKEISSDIAGLEQLVADKKKEVDMLAHATAQIRGGLNRTNSLEKEPRESFRLANGAVRVQILLA